jgi:tight adherence protein B
VEALIALIGGAAVIAVTAALWLPAHAREATMRRRLDGFVEGRERPTVLAADLTARARRRIAVTPTGGLGGAVGRFLQRRITKAQVDLTPAEVVLVVGIASLVVLVAGAALVSPLVAIGAAAAVPAVAMAWLIERAASIQKRFSAQLANTVGLLASSVRTGHSVHQALEHVAHEAPEPTRSAFALAMREIGLGASMEDALTRLLDRYPSEELELVTTAINVQATIGGSLVKVLDAAGETIRERISMAAEVRALTAQQRYSAYVLALLPVFLLAGLRLLSPTYSEELFREGAPRVALISAGVLVTAGFLIMRRMSGSDE